MDGTDTSTEPPTVVLVHGAFADGSSWAGVIDELQADGVPVVAVANPLRGLAYDSTYVTSIVNAIEGPKVLVGHSYGGAVISRAGSDAASVVGLVFVAAFAPDEGESLLEIIGRYADVPLGAALRPAAFTIDGVDTPGTEFFIDGASFHDAFCADLPADQALVMSVSQRPAAVEAFATPLVGTPAWRTLPSWFVVANDDHAIHPDSQRFMAERAGSGVTAIDASHAVAVAQPAAVAAVIRKALS